MSWSLRDVVNQPLKIANHSVQPYSIDFDCLRPLNIITGGCSSGKSEMVRDILRTSAMGQLGLLIEASSAQVPLLDGMNYFPVQLDRQEAAGGWFEQNIRPGVAVIFSKATPRTFLVLDEYATIGTDTADMKDVIAPAYFFIKSALIPTLHCTHFRELARDNLNDPKTRVFAMGIDDYGNPTRQPLLGEVAASNAVQVAQSLGLTMVNALARLRQLGIDVGIK